MSKGALLRFRNNNPLRQCDVPHCGNRRTHTSKHCLRHRKFTAFHGHPEGRAIRPKDLKPYRREFAAFILKHRDLPQVVAARDFMNRLLNLGVSATRDDTLRHTQLHFERLRLGGLAGAEALEVIGSVFLFSKYQPKTLPDDARLTYAYGSVLLKARPIESRKSYDPKTGGTKSQYVGPNGGTRRLVGEAIRSRLGIFLQQVWSAMEDEATRNKELTMTLAQPFPAQAPR